MFESPFFVDLFHRGYGAFGDLDNAPRSFIEAL